MHYGTVVLALALAIASCMWVQMTPLGSFAALLVSAILFFTVYGGVLLFRKEPLAWQMAEKVSRMLFKKGKLGSLPRFCDAPAAVRESMRGSITETYDIKYWKDVRDEISSANK